MNTATQTADFAKTEGARQLQLMNIGTSLQAKKNALAIQRQNFENTQYGRQLDASFQNRKFGLQKDEYRDAKKQGRRALMIGAASLIPKAYMAHQAYKKSGQTSSDVIELAKNIDSMWSRVPTK
jgi:hypothetical protein